MTTSEHTIPAQDDEPQQLPESIPPRNKATAKRTERKGSSLLVFLAVMLVVILTRVFVVQIFTIPSGSMENTLQRGDHVAVTVYDSDEISRGDVIVFHDPNHWLHVGEQSPIKQALMTVGEFVRLLPKDAGHHLIKRVIGMPGDHIVAGEDGQMSINGVTVNEPFLKNGPRSSDIPFDVVVPDNCLWVMGDNRSNSADSRYHMDDEHGGCVPTSEVVGVARVIIWPVTRWDGLGGGEPAFSEIPAPAAEGSAPAAVQQ